MFLVALAPVLLSCGTGEEPNIGNFPSTKPEEKPGEGEGEDEGGRSFLAEVLYQVQQEVLGFELHVERKRECRESLDGF